MPWIGEEPPLEIVTDLWGMEEALVPASVAAALSAGVFAVLAVVAVLLA